MIEGLGGMIGLQSLQKGRSVNPNMEMSDDSDKDLQFIDFMGLGGNRQDNMMITAFENILFYDELLEEENYDH